MFQHSNLPFRLWYLAIAFMCFSKKAVSACEMQRQLKHSRYETIWSLMHRIRNIMGNGEAQGDIEGLIVVGQLFSVIAAPAKIKLTRISYEPKSIDPQDGGNAAHESKGVRSKAGSRYKMSVLSNNLVDSSTCDFEHGVNHGMLVFSTGSGPQLSEHVESVILERVPNQTFSTIKKYSQLAIENAARVLTGIYHKAHVKYLQLYLDEFIFKLNRRHTKHSIFESMMAAVVQSPVLV